MSGRFVIDINVGGQQRRPQQGAVNSGVMATGAGLIASGLTEQGRQPGGLKGLLLGDLGETKSGNERYSKGHLKETRGLLNIEKGRLESLSTRVYEDFTTDRSIGVETTFGYGTRRVGEYAGQHKKAIKGLGVATAYKSMSAAMEINAYSSGDQVRNQRVQEAAKMGGYTAAIAISGFNPVLIAGIVGNEAINAGVQAYKFTYDRKMERSQITNSEVILGDISYGRRRGGR